MSTALCTAASDTLLTSYKFASREQQAVLPSETPPLPHTISEKASHPHHNVNEDNVFALVAIYDPYVQHKAVEIEVSLSSSFFDLARSIQCKATSITGREQVGGAFFFDTSVYVDTRTFTYQEELQNLVKKIEDKYDCHYSVQPMDFLLKDLTVCIGKPYVYLHDLECEHILVFRDIYGSWRKTTTPALEISKTRTTWKKGGVVHQCIVCNALRAVKVVLGTPMAAQSPARFCEDCYVMAHYDCSGELLPHSRNMVVFDLN